MSTIITDDTLKMLRETLCVAQCAVGNFWSETDRRDHHVARLGRMIDSIDEQRPLGSDGKHGDLHTAWCGFADDEVS